LSTTILPSINKTVTSNSISVCSTCFAVFPYIVAESDTLASIAQHFDLATNSIASYNNVTSVYPGEQIYLPFYVDTIKTEMRSSPDQNNYDYYILMYSAEFHLNPMLIKAEVSDESLFNSSAISQYDPAPGVCGTGHSYGLLQYTPTCFIETSDYGIALSTAANSRVLYGENDGAAVINCTSTCASGDYFASEYSDVASTQIVSDLVENSQFSGWNNSVFNPSENLYAVMQIEHMDIDAMIVMGYTGCTYAQYNEMALAQYQQSVSWVINGCGNNSNMGQGSQYIDSVLQTYSELTRNSVYGWTDEYS
jgi:hypothetical protein